MLSPVAVATALALLAGDCSAAGYGRRYDHQIRAAVRRYWPPESHHLHCRYRAQLAAESSLDPRAVSPVGARGLAQFMPATWAQACRAMGWPAAASPHDARRAIKAGAWYLAWLRRRWPESRRELCRQRLAEASYHAGAGSLSRAQRLARRTGRTARCLPEILPSLPAVTGHVNARLTGRYVRKIDRLSGIGGR